MNYHDSRWLNNERNNFDLYFSFLKPLIEAFKFIYILPTHESADSHMASVHVYMCLLKS